MKRTIAFFSFVFASIVSFAQAPKEKTLLWKISGKNITAPSYLYGTFHMLCPKDFTMPENVQQAFHSTQQLYLEIDMDDPSLTKKMMKGITMKDGHTLQEYLKQKDYDSVSKLFQQYSHIPLAAVASYKPFMLSALLYPSMLGCTPIAFEKEFEKMAKKDSMQIYGLETIEDQLNIFDSIPYQQQADMLMKGLYEFDKNKRSLEKLVKTYLQKDVAKLYEETQDDKDFGEYEGVLLSKRNNNWIPVIIREATQKPTFFAVGAGHLGGKEGVIALLRKQGYTVTPVM